MRRLQRVRRRGSGFRPGKHLPPEMLHLRKMQVMMTALHSATNQTVAARSDIAQMSNTLHTPGTEPPTKYTRECN